MKTKTKNEFYQILNISQVQRPGSGFWPKPDPHLCVKEWRSVDGTNILIVNTDNIKNDFKYKTSVDINEYL